MALQRSVRRCICPGSGRFLMIKALDDANLPLEGNIMSKTKLSIFSSILLGSVFALTGAGTAMPGKHDPSNLRGAHAAHLADRFGENRSARPHTQAAGSKIRRPVLLDPSFKIIDEPDADPTLYGTRVFGINEKGQLSGQYVDSDGAFHAFLATPNGDNTFTFAPITVKHGDTFSGFLNDNGEVFGTYNDRHTGIENTWIRKPNGKIETVIIGSEGTIGQGLNNKGVLVGDYVDDNGAMRGFIRDKSGTITYFDVPNAGTGEGQGTNPIGIDEHGDVSGIVIDADNVLHGFIRKADGTYEAPIDIAGAGTGEFEGTAAIEVDDKGWLTGGYVDSNDVSHGFIRNPQGKVAIVDPPDAGTGQFQGTVEVEHREAGWAIGEYIDNNDVYHGFFRDETKHITEFDPPGAGDLGTFTVYSSNRDHVIAGTFKDENGIRHGFLRNP